MLLGAVEGRWSRLLVVGGLVMVVVITGSTIVFLVVIAFG